ncbi:hypothetical protein glysoja_027198, partial [Glycine soja]
QEGVQELDRNPTDVQKVAHCELIKRDTKALFIIHQCVDADNFQKIRSANTAKKAWDILKKSYAGDSKLKKVLRTLTPRFDHIVVAIEQDQNLEEMKIEELQGILKAQEMRLNERNSQRSAE